MKKDEKMDLKLRLLVRGEPKELRKVATIEAKMLEREKEMAAGNLRTNDMETARTMNFTSPTNAKAERVEQLEAADIVIEKYEKKLMALNQSRKTDFQVDSILSSQNHNANKLTGDSMQNSPHVSYRIETDADLEEVGFCRSLAGPYVEGRLPDSRREKKLQ